MRVMLSFVTLLLLLAGCSNQKQMHATVLSGSSKKFTVRSFIQAWNATCRDLNPTLSIPERFGQSSDQTSLSMSFKNATVSNLTLRMQQNKNHQITEIQLSATPQTKPETFAMLSVWSQLIQVMEHDADETYVSATFRLMGIQPNADLSQLNGQRISIQNHTYQCTNQNRTFVFTFKEGSHG